MDKSRIEIKNIGAIKEAVFDLNKINVFMGKQGSGKSTIAKIISFCHWVEKRYLLDVEFDYSFEEQFINFHRIDKNYLNENSFFKYENNFISICYNNSDKEKLKIKEGEDSLDYLSSKNIYIPAERNFVSVIPNLSKFKETNDNIMSFLYDWYEAKKNYSLDDKLSVLKLGIEYYNIKDDDLDKLKLSNESKDILLRNASSGFQSIIPIIVIVDYLTDGIYRNNISKSIDDKEVLYKLFFKFISKSSLDWKEFENSQEVKSKFMDFIKKKSNYNYSGFVIEEPEQNLFPETQKDLVYYLLDRICNTEHKHNLTITTHSPYILYAINNCIMADLLKDKIDDEEKDNLDCWRSRISNQEISIYEIEDGLIKNIQNEDGLIGDNFFDYQMKKVMDDFYTMLNYYD